MKRLLVVVDYQNDFVSGVLGFEEAKNLEPGILQAVEKTLAEGGAVLFTRDCHQEDYLSTREGRFLPLPHCVEGTEGHHLYGGLQKYEQLSSSGCGVAVVDKPVFGCAEIGAQAEALCGGAPESIELCGLVTDICVVTNAILLHSFFPKADVLVRERLVGSANGPNAKAALEVMRGLGIRVE